MARAVCSHAARRLSFAYRANGILLRQNPRVHRIRGKARSFGTGVAVFCRRPRAVAKTLTESRMLTRTADLLRSAASVSPAASDLAARISALAKTARAKAVEAYRRVAARPGVRANALPVSVGAAAVCAIFLLSALMTSDFTYYEYSYGGKVLGVVKNEAEVYAAVSKPEIRKKIDEKAGAPVVLGEGESKNIEVRKVMKFTPEAVPVDEEEDIISNIAALKDIDVVGQTVRYGGENIGTVANAAEADRLLGLLKARWTEGEDADRFSEIGFADEMAQIETTTTRKHIETAEEVFARLERTSFSAIGVRTVEVVQYEEEYEETPVYTDDDERYEDYELIVTPGATGYRKVTADRVRVNGEIVGDEPTGYEVIRPAVAAYAIRGAKKLPSPIGSGRFIRPAEGRSISSPFGLRWGRMHEGIDLDIKYAPVYAAGDGKVVYTGNRGDGYGVMVLIDHGDGFETLYGHLSQTSVGAGEEVRKGQRIATSGNTGRSTGAHLHFEVRVDGTPRNPLDYL
jgi:murein DD-endopeptidase MepM/ murein hydrolase activator NlpD